MRNSFLFVFILISFFGNSQNQNIEVNPPQYYKGLTVLSSATNVVLSSMNSQQIIDPSFKITVPVVSIITGSAQVVYGIMQFPDEQTTYPVTSSTTIDDVKSLSRFNVTIGASTILISTINLIVRHKSIPKETVFNVYPIIQPKQNPGVAFTLKISI